MNIKTFTMMSLLLFSHSAMAETVVGFAQVGSESGWRTNFSNDMRDEATRRGITLKFADSQQQQANQIRAVRTFIAMRVDAIVVAPVVETGWTPILRQAQRSNIPVIILDRNIRADEDLYLTRIASDFVEEGVKAAEWLVDNVQGECRVVELQGTVGSTAAIDRGTGFNRVIDAHDRISIVRSQTAEFTRNRGKEVMENFLRAEDPRSICALWAHNDEMALGAIQAIREAGLRPGQDIRIISVDGIPDYFLAMANGVANVTVELDPHLGAPTYDVIQRYLSGDTDIPKLIRTTGDVFTQATAEEEYQRRTQ
ncbi:ABC transporter substrate-binding protein [Aliidiomarina soli]|uniref:Sugar ABC transporter substrate-binding protein n=1 Tax=Aliidiomarina soli TaxID=1928574 RepID=A0A432WF87_9GAMM|nr:ABC transporter substrate-binding protein [Aliidiomarina soli]RUO32440.1 sugar ABC transporter substrate-binding protein [Aliidiomarina soli]